MSVVDLPYAVVDTEASQLPEYWGKDTYFTSFSNAVPRADVDLVWLSHPALIQDVVSI